MNTNARLPRQSDWRQRYFVSFAAALVILPLPAFAQVSINEAVSSNGVGLTDEDGDHSDWLEFYNSGPSPVDLNGYGLTDSPSNPYKWVFPSILLQSNEYLVVFASNKNRKSGPYLHTNFAISADGETLVLTKPNGSTESSLPSAVYPRDSSFGRQPDGSDHFYIFNQPTPAASNTTVGYQNVLNDVQFSVAGGFYTTPQTLILSPGQAAVTIRYTLDGSEPSETSPIYTTPLSIQSRIGAPNDISMIPTTISPYNWEWKPPVGEVFKATIVRAKAFKEGFQNSRSMTHTYFVDPAIQAKYALPIVSLGTHRDNLFDFERGIYVPGATYDGNLGTGNYYGSGDTWERPVSFEFFEPGGTRAYFDNCGVRIHGGWSSTFAMKSLRLYFSSDYGQDYLNYQIFPGNIVDKYKRIILRNEGNDNYRAFMRDAVIQSLRDPGKVDGQAARLAIVFINGEFWGLHRIRERQDKYYLSTRYGINPDNLDLLETTGTVSEGSNTDWLDLRLFMYNNDLANPINYTQVEAKIDIDDFINYCVLEIYARNTDWPVNNIKYWRTTQTDNKWRWLLYDTDSGFGWTGEPDYFKHDTLGYATERAGTSGLNTDTSTILLRSLMRNRDFRFRFLNAMADKLNTAFLPENVLSKIEEHYSEQQPYMVEHIARWGHPVNLTTWNESVDQMRTFAVNRPEWVWKQCSEFTGIDGTYNVTLNASPSSGGSVQISSVIRSGSGLPWTGRYFSEVPVTVAAIAAPGFQFSHWIGHSGATPQIQLTPMQDVALTAVFTQEVAQ